MHWAGFWHWIEHENCITHIFDDKFLNSKKGDCSNQYIFFVCTYVTSFFKYVDGIHKLCIVETVDLMSWEVFLKNGFKDSFSGIVSTAQLHERQCWRDRYQKKSETKELEVMILVLVPIVPWTIVKQHWEFLISNLQI